MIGQRDTQGYRQVFADTTGLLGLDVQEVEAFIESQLAILSAKVQHGLFLASLGRADRD